MSAPTSSYPPPTQLKVLTLNIWALAHISKARPFRVQHIADRIVEGDWDVVALQEIWVESEDWRLVRSICSERLGYSKFFYSGAAGSGLAMLSRFPIIATHTNTYSLNSHPIYVGHGDWFVGKAAGCVTLDLGQGMIVDVWNTHTVAAGGEDGPEKMRAHRIAQAWELAKFVQNSAEKGRHVIALGDFNSTPPALSIAILRHLGQLNDAFLTTHPSLPANAVSLPGYDPSSGSSVDPHRAIAELGVTCDSPLNTWTAGKPLDARARVGAGKRLDYIFYRGPAPQGLIPDKRATQGRLRPKSCQVCFTELIPGSNMSYTDHFGVEAVFEVAAEEEQTATDSALSAVATRNLSTTLSSAIAALGAYTHHAGQTQRTHLLGFAGCVTTALGLAVMTPFIGYRGYSFWAGLAVVLATAAGFGGTTLLYSGLIWGEWEKRALRTAIESLELDLSLLSKEAPRSSNGETLAQPPSSRQQPLLI